MDRKAAVAPPANHMVVSPSVAISITRSIMINTSHPIAGFIFSIVPPSIPMIAPLSHEPGSFDNFVARQSHKHVDSLALIIQYSLIIDNKNKKRQKMASSILCLCISFLPEYVISDQDSLHTGRHTSEMSCRSNGGLSIDSCLCCLHTACLRTTGQNR